LRGLVNLNNKIISKLYKDFLILYGPQGWWPLLDVKGTNPTKTGSVKGYHPGDYDYPKTDEQKFEICVGAILAQNTSWTNVEKALRNLKRMQALHLKGIKRLSIGKLKEAIKPAGYYNQKTKKLLIFIDFYKNLGDRAPSREELLELWGIGPETADSILLYAYKIPEFVVDTYSSRLLLEEKLIDKKATYEEIKELFEKNIEKDFKVFQEFHALMVEHGKNI